MSCQWVWNKCDYFIKLVFSKCSQCSFLSHFSNSNHKSRTARKSDCYKTRSVNVTFVNREEKSEPKENKLQTCNCSYRSNCLGRTRMHTYPAAYTDWQRDRERERVLVATCVCQTRRSDTPDDTLEAWRWTEGNKSIASASVREMWPSSAKSRLSTPKTESARHRVEKVHIPLSTHAQSVTRSWFKNTRADSCGPCWPAFMNTASSLQVNGP